MIENSSASSNTAAVGRATLIPGNLRAPTQSLKSLESLESLGAPEQYGTHPLHSTFIELYDAGVELTQMKPNVWRRPRFFHLTQILGLTAGLPGATAETGCFRGLTSFLTCHYLRMEKERVGETYTGKNHLMIDSYEGLSQPVGDDGGYAKSSWEKKAFTSTSVQRVAATMYQFPDVEIIKGWIPEVFSTLGEQSYRFVHVDVDLYQPTLDSLRYFYARMTTGGIIVIDDYGPWPKNQWPGCLKAVQEFSREQDVPFAPLDTGNAIIIKR